MTMTMEHPRPDERPELQRPEHRWWPLTGVLVGLIVIVAGGYVVAGGLSEPAGPPIDVAGTVQIQPLSGWSLAGRGTTPSGVPGVPVALVAQLTRGGGNIDVAAYPGQGTPEELAAVYQRVLEVELIRLSVSSNLETVRTSRGLQGVGFTYSGVLRDTSTSIDGEVTILISPAGNGAVFDGWAPAGLLSYASGDIHTMINKAVVA
jgi:hypothetical protein